MASSIGERMARVRTKGTAPELEVRRLLSREGVRYRLHRRDLPGTPDLYVPRLRLAVFVHGCFWHGHECPRGSRPKTNTDFWTVKIATNMERDERARAALADRGIDSLELWTCRHASFAIHCAIVGRRYRDQEVHDDAAASA
jgi:DNA mismatch endonuclease (patch repair protein)